MKCQVSKHHIIDIYIYNTLSEENQQLELRLVWARDEDWGASTQPEAILAHFVVAASEE